jgi:hypothetical protein
MDLPLAPPAEDAPATVLRRMGFGMEATRSAGHTDPTGQPLKT